MLWWTSALAWATSDFDASSATVTYTGEETYLQDGTIQLWGQIEKHVDPDRTLFRQEDFNASTEWPDESDWAPWIAQMFGDSAPHSSEFLLHVSALEPVSQGTPVLFVPGAGDNGSRGFITMATKLANEGRPVFVLTFAHPHGDVFMQAEVVADAIARIKHRRGVDQVDVVGHSKGGIAAAVYASNHASADWPSSAYEAVGTVYDDDIRRLVLIGTPLDGIDTAFRWPAQNYASLDADTAVSPTSWRTHYPYGTGVMSSYTHLDEQDFLAANGDLFPGHRQILRRQDHELPGAQAWLGPYALMQIDWYTTYEGGWGYYSVSDGIDDAIDDGGHTLDALEAAGVDPAIEIFLLAGENPLLHNGAEYQWIALMGETWVDLMTQGSDAWADWMATVVEEAGAEVDPDEVRGLAQGKLILGEITGPSDGLVFLSSATHGETLTARGASIEETRVVDLAHLDLLYASPITGQILIDYGEADPVEDGWMRAVGQRYIEADTLGWVVEVLADPHTPDSGDTGVEEPDSGLDTADPDNRPGGSGGLIRNCDGCASEGGASGGSSTGLAGLLGLLGLALLRRR